MRWLGYWGTRTMVRGNVTINYRYHIHFLYHILHRVIWCSGYTIGLCGLRATGGRSDRLSQSFLTCWLRLVALFIAILSDRILARCFNSFSFLFPALIFSSLRSPTLRRAGSQNHSYLCLTHFPLARPYSSPHLFTPFQPTRASIESTFNPLFPFSSVSYFFH